MSIRIVKAGLSDTVQDAGRYHYQHLGINPGGVMDNIAHKVVNALTGNSPNEAVLEMHFPASEILFQQDALIALAGANFNASIKSLPIPIHQPVIISKGCVLTFKQPLQGARVYLGVRGGFSLKPWLGSYSTHVQCGKGGLHGRPLDTNVVLALNVQANYTQQLRGAPFFILPVTANVQQLYNYQQVYVLPGCEYSALTPAAKQQMEEQAFIIGPQSNRMGYRLHGSPLQLEQSMHMVSAAVTRGTVQLLPNGQLMILMADHQTTGGYPVIGHVTSTALSSLAQLNSGQTINFTKCSEQEALNRFRQQQQHLTQLQNACIFRLAELL